MKDEYIRKADAVEALGEEYAPRTDFERGMVSQMSCDKAKIKALPTADVVTVVRCKDCTNAIFNKLDGRKYCVAGFEKTIASAYVAIGNPIFARRDDDFCSYGERREE